MMSMQQHLDLINQHGNTVKDVSAAEFISSWAKHLKKGNKVKIPGWAKYTKTSCARELAPYDDDWLYVRAASVSYQLYMRKKCGVHTLRKHYGGNKRMGTCTEHFAKAAGKNIRYCFQQLEASGYVGTAKYISDDDVQIIVGKSLTKKGITDMDRIAAAIIKDRKAKK